MSYPVRLPLLLVFALAPVSTCLAQQHAPVDGIYVYGPPTAGHSTSLYHYSKNWRGPRYSYPQTYYFKFPPGRRPLKFYPPGLIPFIDPLFFHGATTDAEIWAVRRKGEVASLPDQARFPVPAKTRLVPTTGRLPARRLGAPSTEGVRRLGW